jgi:hypothetical protein
VSAATLLAEGGSIGSQAATMVAALVGMLAIAYVAWKAVQRQEKGDAELAAKLKADDERAAAGLRAEMGLPPERPGQQVPPQAPHD